MDEPEAHRFFSATCFNRVWELLDKPDRSEEEDRLMVETAHASFYHWLERDDCTHENRSIGFWQISRVYASIGDSAQAFRYAEQCIEISDRAGLSPFHRGYAFEAAARACKLANHTEEFARFLMQAQQLAVEVTDPQDRELLESDLASLA